MSDFSDVYQRYAADVFHFALYLTGNRADAEDITSETFVRLWSSGEPVRMPTLKAYLLTIARNLFLHGLRRQARRVELPDDLADLAPGPHEQAERKAELLRVMRRLQELPEVDRSALLLRAVAGLPYEDIAQALGITPASARVKVHRARLALDHQMDSPGASRV